MSQDNIKALPFKRPQLAALRDEIKELIYSYEGRTSLAEAIGILEIVKHELIEEHT